ncbi:MAG: hypothetical protein P4L46_01705 [Fimbriimonas sp.]|nr:hypothetical protein [Fimbriimonas sp.]
MIPFAETFEVASLLRVMLAAGLLSVLMATAAAAPGSRVPQSVSLNGTWRLSRLSLDDAGPIGLAKLSGGNVKTIDGQVPGEVHLDLMRAGEMEDPSVSSNSRKDRWPERYSWWYRTHFDPPADFLDQDRQEIVFDGLIYNAQVFLNGALIGSSQNGLVPYRLDVTGLLKPGDNDLAIRLTSGYELIGEVDPDTSKQSLYAGRENFPARSKLRTPPYMSGWDWCDTLPNIGIWRSVHLEGRSHAALGHVRLDTEVSGKKVALSGEVEIQNLHAWRQTPCRMDIELERPNGTPVHFSKELLLPIGVTRIPCRFEVPQPVLWWPNGMGDQPLYRLNVSLTSGGSKTDAVSQTIGLRTVQLDQSLLPDGSNFRFIVNGRRMFAKGGNWAPADEIPARMTKARYDHFIDAAKEAHFDLLRVNGVGYYEDDEFYEACDRAGVLLWQEFAYSCSTYDDASPDFMRDAGEEAEAFVKRIAHHPSLALWCGCNECLWMYAGDKNPRPTDVIGTKIYTQLLPTVCHSLDPCRPYIPASPCGGSDEINSQTGGDVHWWYQVFMCGDPARKMNPALLDECTGRFVSEYGIIGPPPLASMKEYLKPEELNPNSLAWRIHTNSYEGDHRGFTESAAKHHFTGDGPLPVEDFVLYGGLYQAMMQEAMIEACRFRKDDAVHSCDGVLMWSYNDCWGEIGWSIIDHYGRRKPSYYAVKRACAPVKAIVRSRDGKLVTRIVNDSGSAKTVNVTFGWYRVDGSAKDVRTRRLRVGPDAMVELARVAMDDTVHDAADWIYAAHLTADGVPDDHSIWKRVPCRELRMAPARLHVKIDGDNLQVTSDSFCSGVHLSGGEGQLSDDYFELLPGVPHTVRVQKQALGSTYRFVVAMPRLR